MNDEQGRDRGQAGGGDAAGQGSWWADPGATDATRPVQASGDAGDPYRQAPTEQVPQSSPTGYPDLPGAPQQHWQQQHGQGWYGQPSSGQEQPPRQASWQAGPWQAGSWQAGSWEGRGAPQGAYGQYGQHGQLHNEVVGDPRLAPALPVAGSAHAVLWTAVGGLLLIGAGIGVVAAIVALALVPGARRRIDESQGRLGGRGFLLAGKIVAWVTIGLFVLVVLLVALLVGVGAFASWNDGGSYYDDSYAGDFGTAALLGVLAPAA